MATMKVSEVETGSIVRLADGRVCAMTDEADRVHRTAQYDPHDGHGYRGTLIRLDAEVEVIYTPSDLAWRYVISESIQTEYRIFDKVLAITQAMDPSPESFTLEHAKSIVELVRSERQKAAQAVLERTKE